MNLINLPMRIWKQLMTSSSKDTLDSVGELCACTFETVTQLFICRLEVAIVGWLDIDACWSTKGSSAVLDSPCENRIVSRTALYWSAKRGGTKAENGFADFDSRIASLIRKNATVAKELSE